MSATGVASDLRVFLAVHFSLAASVDVHYVADPMPNEADCRVTVLVRGINGPPDVIMLGRVRDALRDRLDARSTLDVRPAWCLTHEDCREHHGLGRACWEAQR